MLAEMKGDPLEAYGGQVVMHRGSPEAKLMVIGEAPGAEEDRLGTPFVGRSGELLDRILAAVDIDSNHDAYITNIVKRRPPNNRDPLQRRSRTICACPTEIAPADWIAGAALEALRLHVTRRYWVFAYLHRKAVTICALCKSAAAISCSDEHMFGLIGHRAGAHIKAHPAQ